MATAKKGAGKPAKKNVKKTVAKKSTPLVANPPATSAPAADAVADAGRRGPGRPKGSANKKPGRKPGRKAGTPGRKPSTRFLYSIGPVSDSASDDLGLGGSTATPAKVSASVSFPTVDADIQNALGQIPPTRNDLEITLYRDYRTGRPEVKTRLV